MENEAMRSLPVWLLLSVLGMWATGMGAAQDTAEQPLVFECGPVFGPGTTSENLAAAFGDANVVSVDSIGVGEDLYEPGVVIFGDTDDRVELTWGDPSDRYSSNRASIGGDQGSWHTPRGLRLGLDLRSVEVINGRPFQLTGFAWDYQGTVLSWEGGRLEGLDDARCRMIVRLQPERDGADAEFRRAYSQVRGDRLFSSAHWAMRLLNPKVYELLILWPPDPADPLSRPGTRSSR